MSQLIPYILEQKEKTAEKKWKKIFEDGFHICFRCKKTLEISEFRIIKNRTYPYCNSMCRACDNLRTTKFKKNKSETIEGKAYFLFSNIKRRCFDKDLECEIDENYIIDLYKKQNGLCYYTGVEMQLSSNDKSENRKNVSVDRIDSSKGYLKSNVVLCCWVVNNIKQDLSVYELKKWCKLIYENL